MCPQYLEQVEGGVVIALELLHQLVDQTAELGLAVLAYQRLFEYDLVGVVVGGGGGREEGGD